MTKPLHTRRAATRRRLVAPGSIGQAMLWVAGMLCVLALPAPSAHADEAGPVAATAAPSTPATGPAAGAVDGPATGSAADSVTGPAPAAAAAPAPVPSTVAPPRPTIIDLPVEESTYENAESCIAMRDIRDHVVLDDRHIVFELRRGRYVLSQFKQRCEYLRQQDTIALHAVGGGSRLCALDQVSVLESNMGVGRAVGGFDNIGGFTVIGRCFLGPFEEITKEQLAGLRDAVRARQRDDDGLWDWISGD